MERLTIVAFIFFAIDAGEIQRRGAAKSITDRSERALPAFSGSASEQGVYFYCGVQHHQIISARNFPRAEFFQMRGYPLSIEQQESALAHHLDKAANGNL
jgi:hypothetical protein